MSFMSGFVSGFSKTLVQAGLVGFPGVLVWGLMRLVRGEEFEPVEGVIVYGLTAYALAWVGFYMGAWEEVGHLVFGSSLFVGAAIWWGLPWEAGEPWNTRRVLVGETVALVLMNPWLGSVILGYPVGDPASWFVTVTLGLGAAGVALEWAPRETGGGGA